MITENLSTLKIHKLTQAQYDRELAAGNIDENALYLTPDEEIDLSGYATISDVEELQTKVGDTAVSEQIASAIANKIDSPDTAFVGQVLSVKSIDEEGKIVWEATSPDFVGGNIVTDETLSREGAAADAKVTGDAIAEINSKLADIMYEEIVVSSFTNNIGNVEIGSTVTNVTLNWKTNKTPTMLTLDGASIDTASTSTSYSNLSIKSDKTWTLAATDERDAVSTKTTTIKFYNGIYYGVIDSGTTITNETIIGLTKKLQSTKSVTFTVTANAGQYIIYALPSDYDTPLFNVGGFDGGFSLNSTFNFTNASGHTESYCVWISDNAGLGETTVKVS